MSYIPKNVQIFTAAFCGCLAGMGASDRRIIDTDPLAYAGVTLVAGAFAQAIDTAWASRATTSLDVAAMQSVCEGYWASRSPLNNTDNTNPASFAGAALAIIAAITAGEGYYGLQGISQPAVPGTSNYGWQTAIDVDFRLENSQVLSPDGTYTIKGRPWLKRNSANDRVAMQIIKGTGLVIAPGSVSNWDGGVYTMPLLEIPFQSISAGLAFGRATRITVYVDGNGSNFGTNFNFLSFGISSQSGVAGYQLSHGYNGGQKNQVGVIGTSVASNLATAVTFSPQNDVLRLLIPNLGQPSVYSMTAAHGDGQEEIPDEQYFQNGPSIIDNTRNEIGLTRSNVSLVIGALRAGGADATFSVTINRLVVEYLGEAVAGSASPGTSLAGLQWRLPFITNLGAGNWSCPANVTEVAVMSGEDNATYNVTLRFQGAVETKAYVGGTNDGAYWQVGGAPAATNFNVYKLTISNPPQTYYLNRSAADGDPVAIDYSKTVQIAANATVTLFADSIDSQERFQNLTVPGVASPPQPYAGQFINMTVTDISKV